MKQRELEIALRLKETQETAESAARMLKDLKHESSFVEPAVVVNNLVRSMSDRCFIFSSVYVSL